MKLALRLLAGMSMKPFAGETSGGGPITRYVRYERDGRVAAGLLEGDRIRELSASPFESGHPTGADVALSDVRLLAPCTPSKVIAVGLNYKSHLQGRPEAGHPGIFIKLPSSIVGPGADVVFPEGAGNVHYEGEMVVVIGRRASKVPQAEAHEYVFGITCGNDISERDWQKKDLQWFRAKASDTFGPLGPAIVRGLDYRDLELQTRVNGEVRQRARTSDLIFPVDEIISFVTRFVTLEPGDVIYTGTPGTTQAMQPGDEVEVEIEGVGVLRNRIAGTRAKTS